MTTDKILLEYEELHQQEKDIKERKELLSQTIKDTMVGQNATETPYLKNGKIILVPNKQWSYTESVSSLEKAVKEMKKQERHDRIAILNEGSFIKYQKCQNKEA